MFCYADTLAATVLENGVQLRVLGHGERMTVLHWDMPEGTILPLHEHPHEQFGYVIKGGFDMTVGQEKATLKAGDSYFIPPNTLHTFTAVGDTEAIDVFSPVRESIPFLKKT